MSDRIWANMQSGKPSLGILLDGGPQIVDAVGQAGFDFVVPDMMWTRMDWNEVHHMIRAAHAAGLACYPRIQAYPWASGRPDRHLAADAARTLGMGADGVCMSVSCSEEVRDVAVLAGDWHRGVQITSAEEVKAHEERMRERTLILPLIESRSAIDEIDRIVDVDGLTGIFIAWTDFTKQLGLDFQYEHPEVLKLVVPMIERARKQGLVVMANTGYAYADPEANAQRIARMAAMGVQLIMMQTVEFLVYSTLKRVVERLRDLPPVGETAGRAERRR